MQRAVTGGAWWLSPKAAAVAAIAPTVLAVFVCAHQLTLHGVLHGVVLRTEGPNLGSAIALTRGQLPYSNFPLAQPPGMTLVMLPFAWLSHFVSGSVVLPLTRAATCVATVVAVYLAGFSARNYGVPASLLAGVFTAVYPFEFFSTGGVTVGPWLLVFVLLGMNCAFTEGVLASRNRVIFGALLLGFACTIKPWAGVPALVFLGCVIGSGERRTLTLPALGGLVVGGGVPCAAFLLPAPAQFWRDVVVPELPGHGVATATSKLATVLGLGAPSGFTHPGGVALAIAIAIGALALVTCVAGYTSSLPIDWMITFSAVGLLAAALLPGTMAVQYGELALPFAALAVTMTASRLTTLLAASWSGSGTDMRSNLAAAVAVLMAACAAVVAAIGAPAATDYAATYANHHALLVSPEIDHHVRSHVCAISDVPMLLIEANRFNEGSRACPVVVDPQGVIAISKASNGAIDAVSEWDRWINSAHSVVLAVPTTYLPAEDRVKAYMDREFALLFHDRHVLVYQRTV